MGRPFFWVSLSLVTQYHERLICYDLFWQVDVYSFAMILFQLFEHTPPFAGVDPVEAAKAAALENSRPRLERLKSSQSPMPVRADSAYHLNIL